MSQTIVSANNFNETKLTITAPKVLPNANGARQSYTNYSGGKFYIQTPKNLSVPFGLDIFRDEASGKEAFSMNLSLRGFDSDPEIKGYYDMLKKVDDIILEEAYKNRKVFFPKNKDITKDTIRTLYKSALKETFDDDGNMKYAPVHKIKFKKDREGQFETKFWNENKQSIKDKSIDELIVKQVQLSVIVRCSGITFAGAGFSCSWVAEQVMIHKLPESLSSFAFQGFGEAPVSVVTDDSDSSSSNIINDDDVLSAVMPIPTPSASIPTSSPLAQFADDEDESAEEDAIPVPKKPTIVKKTTVITKKK